MKYFVNEAVRKASHSSCYIEFQKGLYHDKCWLQDSVSISDTLWNEFNLSTLIGSVIVDFDYYGITVVTKNQWNKIVENSREAGSDWENIIAEAISWVNDCFEEHDVFTIPGI